MKFSRLLLIAAVLGVAVIVALFVVLDITDIFRLGHPVSSTTYATRVELVKDWDKSAPWLPNDATGIQIKEVKQYGPEFDPAILRAVSHSALNPALCAQTSRLTSPALTASWSPDAHDPKVYVCGDWDVIPAPDGWFGWTKNSPRERAAAAVLLKSRGKPRRNRRLRTRAIASPIRLPSVLENHWWLQATRLGLAPLSALLPKREVRPMILMAGSTGLPAAGAHGGAPGAQIEWIPACVSGVS